MPAQTPRQLQQKLADLSGGSMFAGGITFLQRVTGAAAACGDDALWIAGSGSLSSGGKVE
jgi:hypothetical protein